MELTSYRIQVLFANGIQRIFEAEEESIQSFLCDLEEAYGMSCELEGVFKGYSFERDGQ